MSEATYTCEQCSAVIYHEQIQKRRAGKVGGKLLCATCVTEKIKELQSRGAAATTSAVLSSSGVISAGSAPVAKSGAASGVIAAPPPPKPVASADPEGEPLSLIEEDVSKANEPKPQIRSFVQSSLAQADRHDKFSRPMVGAGEGATRAHTFHSKLTDAALSYMDNQINEWVDAHPEIFLKFTTSTIGMFEAKQHQEPHLIVTVFY